MLRVLFGIIKKSSGYVKPYPDNEPAVFTNMLLPIFYSIVNSRNITFRIIALSITTILLYPGCKTSFAPDTNSYVRTLDIEHEPADPYQLYHPLFHATFQENQYYSEWNYGPLFLLKNLKDTLSSGDSTDIVRFGWIDLTINREIPLPPGSKKIDILFTGHCMSAAKQMKGSTSLRLIIRQLKGAGIVQTDSLKMDFPETAPDMSVRTFPSFHLAVRRNREATQMAVEIKSNDRGGFIFLHRCDIRIDSKPLKNYHYDQTLPFSQAETDTFKTLCDTILRFSGPAPEILAIGESLHGTKEFTQQQAELIRQWVTCGKCKLILLETPYLFGFKLNRYIQGEPVDIEETFGRGNYLDQAAYYELWDFLREYNRKSTVKVSLAGIDYTRAGASDEAVGIMFDLYRNDDTVRKVKEKWDELSKQEDRENNAARKKRELLLSLITGANALNDEQELKEWQMLARNVTFSHDANDRYEDNRDSMMAENVAFALEKWGKKGTTALLSAHLGHVSVAEEYAPRPSAGWYLRRKFGKRYRVLAQLAGGGSSFCEKRTGYYRTEWGNHCVTPPIGGSLEQLCRASGLSFFYINDLTGDWARKISYIRNQGRIWRPMQFRNRLIPETFDSFVFFDRVNGVEIPIKTTVSENIPQP